MDRMQADGDSSWSSIVALPFGAPLFLSRPRIHVEQTVVTVTSGWRSCVAVGVVGGIGAAVIGLALWLWRTTPWPFACGAGVVGVFGLGWIALAIIAWVQRPTLFWRKGEGELRVRSRRYGRLWESSIPVGRIRVEMDRIAADDVSSASDLGKVGIWLVARIRYEDRSLLAVGPAEQMRPLFRALAEVVGEDHTADHTVLHAETRGATGARDPAAEVEVDTTPLGAVGGGDSNHSAARLVWKTSELAEFRRTWSNLALALVLLGLGCVLWGVEFYPPWRPDDGVAVAFIGVFALFSTVAGALQAFLGAGLYHTSVDFCARQVLLEPVLPFVRRRVFEFDQVHALQICVVCEARSDGGGSITYELNLVLRDPPGERVNLACHGAYSDLRDEANLIGQRMGRPVLYHTLSSQGETQFPR